MTIVRVGDLEREDRVIYRTLVKGTYSTNNGTFTGKLSGIITISSIEAEWKDDTGTGKMNISVYDLDNDKLKGDWERTTGTGPPKGTWEGRCVEAK
jgi:hypothetical protein